MIKQKNAKTLWHEFQNVRLNIDEINTPNLSKIKEIIKRMHFADITSEQQVQDNKGDAFYKLFVNDDGDYFNNLTLSYTVEAKKTGLVYGTFKEEKDDEGNKKVAFKYDHFTNYARFLADVASQKVIYSKEIERFVIVMENSFKPIDDVAFAMIYKVDKKNQINDFLEVIENIFKEVITKPTHDYKILPDRFAGEDWFYDCKNLKIEKRKPAHKELYFAYYPVEIKALDFDMPDKFLNLVADGDSSLHNLRLIHAYVMQRKLNIISAEQWFLMKDFGRAGKGLFMRTFNEIFKVNSVTVENLMKGGFEASNEWLNFYGAELAHANESGEITKQMMRIFRKIASNEIVTARAIGENSVTFKIRAVLLLDTNEPVDTGQITANTARTVKIAFKDRPRKETKAQRYEVFKPYWDFISPEGKDSVAASLSFLIYSLNYLKAIGGTFKFEDVALKNYFSADDLTETQCLLLTVISKDGFILSKDDTLQQSIADDYGSLRMRKAQDDIRHIGVKLNAQKKIEGQNFKVNVVGDKELFERSLKLLEEER